MKDCSRLIERGVIPVFFIVSILGIFHNSVAGPIAEGCDKFLGNVSTARPPSNFADYWNQVTLENNGKWENVEPNRDQMNWGPVSEAYNYCKQKKFPYRHHTFLWNEQYPKSWFDKLSASEKKAEVEELIKEFGQKFPETDFIDVVNESIDKSPAWKDALGGDGKTGYDWMIWGFEMCRQYIPKAKLAINEYYCEYDTSRVRKYLKIINILKERNLIDCIGIQTHDGETKKGYEMGVLKQCIDTLATAGLPIYSTELDLAGTDEEQLEWYKKIFPIIWEHPAIRGVTLWGWTDSWLLDLSKPKDARLIIDGRERPALKWLREYVSQHKTATKIYSIRIFSPNEADNNLLSSVNNYRIVRFFDLLGRCGYPIIKDKNFPKNAIIIPKNTLRTPFVFETHSGSSSEVRLQIPER